MEGGRQALGGNCCRAAGVLVCHRLLPPLLQAPCLCARRPRLRLPPGWYVPRSRFCSRSLASRDMIPALGSCPVCSFIPPTPPASVTSVRILAPSQTRSIAAHSSLPVAFPRCCRCCRKWGASRRVSACRFTRTSLAPTSSAQQASTGRLVAVVSWSNSLCLSFLFPAKVQDVGVPPRGCTW